MDVILHISSKIWFESLYRVALNNLTMKAEMTTGIFYEKTRFLPSYFICNKEGTESSFFVSFKHKGGN